MVLQKRIQDLAKVANSQLRLRRLKICELERRVVLELRDHLQNLWTAADSCKLPCAAALRGAAGDVLNTARVSCRLSLCIGKLARACLGSAAKGHFSECSDSLPTGKEESIGGNRTAYSQANNSLLVGKEYPAGKE